MTDPVSLAGATDAAPAAPKKAATKVAAKSFGAALTSAQKATSPKASAVTGGTTAQAAPKTDPAAVLRPQGEKLQKVDGHPYAKIASGVDKGMYLNQLAGNPRKGEAFRVVQRDGKTFHVYGTGAHKVVEEIKPHAAAKTAKPSTGKKSGA